MLMTGMTTSTPTTTKASEVRPHRTHPGSSSACRPFVVAADFGLSSRASVLMAHTPAFELVDDDQQRKGENQQHHGDGCRLPVSELLKPGNNEDRRDLRLIRHVARDKDNRAIFPDAASEC